MTFKDQSNQNSVNRNNLADIKAEISEGYKKERDRQTEFNNATDWFGHTESCCVLHLLAFALLMFFLLLLFANLCWGLEALPANTILNNSVL